MSKRLVKIIVASAVAVTAVAAAAEAAQIDKLKLPILVDKYHAIKNPAGPVSKGRMKIGKARTLKLKNRVDPSTIIPPNGHIVPTMPGG